MHVETPLVKIFGNSVIFSDHLGSLPMIFQTIGFYPDWLFMTWPLELFRAFVSNGTHPYFDGMGPGAIGWSIVWLLAGVVCGVLGTSSTFINIRDVELPLLIRIPYKMIVYLLFWHIVIARMAGALITRLTTWSYRLSMIIERTVFAVMLIPPVIGLIISTVIVFGYFVR